MNSGSMKRTLGLGYRDRCDAGAALGVDRVIEREQSELQRRERLYRGDHPAVPVQGREVIIVDDGLATGATMRAAVQAIRQLQPRHVTVAVPDRGARELRRSRGGGGRGGVRSHA